VTSPYRRVLSIPGAVAFSLTGVVARLPISMISLGIVLLVSATTGSYSRAGGISASYVAATAVGAVPLARIVDRRGQSVVLGPAVTFSVTALTVLMVAVERGWPTPWPQVFAALSGLAMPNVGAAVRARWAYVVEERVLLDTAFAVEAVNDELVFIVGPTAVTLLATTVHPLAGLVAAGGAALGGTWLLVGQRRTEPRLHAEHHDLGQRPPLRLWRMTPLLVGAAMLGVLFGGNEVAVVAFCDEAGNRALAGLLLAIWALGSLLSGLVVGTVNIRRPAATRYRWGVFALALAMAPLPLVPGVVSLAVVLFVAGFAISPTLIAAVSWVEAIVPPARLNEGMTIFTTGLVLGVAPGAALVGAVVDAAGASRAFLVPVAAGILATVAAQWRTDARPAPGDARA
jgi:MFS family permease